MQPDTKSPFAKPQPKEDLDATLPPRGARSQMKLPQVKAEPPPPPAPQPGTDTEGTKKKGGGALGAIALVVVLLAVLGGLGWAVTMGPLKDKLAQLDEQPPPVDTGPQKLDPNAGTKNGEKPAWLIEKEKQKALEEEEKRKQAEIEAAANDPERQRMLAELEAELKQLDYLEAEQRSLKLAAQQGAAAGAANTKRIDDLQKQIDELKTLVADKQKKKATAPATKPPTGTTPNEGGEVEIVKGTKGAKEGGIGYLSLRTINPSSANVMLSGDGLGSTPLNKVPVEAGVHKLTVIDGDGKARLLSVTIEAGKTAEMRGVDVNSLPFAK